MPNAGCVPLQLCVHLYDCWTIVIRTFVKNIVENKKTSSILLIVESTPEINDVLVSYLCVITLL